MKTRISFLSRDGAALTIEVLEDPFSVGRILEKSLAGKAVGEGREFPGIWDVATLLIKRLGKKIVSIFPKGRGADIEVYTLTQMSEGKISSIHPIVIEYKSYLNRIFYSI